jgi:asparagine synthase (glutamine-hydrolysing)
MKGRLPDGILHRGKAGLDVPAHEWLRGSLFPFLQETLQPSVVRRTDLFDADYVSRLIRDHRERRINAGYHLWALMTLFLWLKRWDIAIPPAAERTMFLEPELLAAAS